ncbi:hypothetical protein ACFE04_013289 [Oxalis oulophora]
MSDYDEFKSYHSPQSPHHAEKTVEDISKPKVNKGDTLMQSPSNYEKKRKERSNPIQKRESHVDVQNVHEQKLRCAQLKYPAIFGRKGVVGAITEMAEEGISDPPHSEGRTRSRKNKDGYKWMCPPRI